MAAPAALPALPAGKTSYLFPSHNWGEGGLNHRRVKLVVDAFKKAGKPCFFDEEQLKSNHIAKVLCTGIDESVVFLAFITEAYVAKVAAGAGANKTDWCEFEFTYIVDGRKHEMIPVVMEEAMLETSVWRGPVKGHLGGMMYIDFTSDDKLDACVAQICDRIRDVLGAKTAKTDPLAGIDETNCEKIVDVLLQNRENPEVLAAALKMIVDIDIVSQTYKEGKYKKSPIRRIGNVPGAMELVVAALRAFGKTHEEVARWGCLVVWELAACECTNQQKLGEAGACELVVVVLRVFGKMHAKVAENGCYAVAGLAGRNDANMEKLGQAGACEAVVAVLSAFGKTNDGVAEKGCFAVGILANNNANRARLNASDATPIVGACVENRYKSYAIEWLE